MDPALQFAVDLARTTGQMLLTRFNRNGVASDLKADRSLVTDADWAADRLIADAIREQYPGESLVSEELSTVLPERSSEVVWVIDPLDGTTNFSLGLPIWGVSIARVNGGWPDLAALYFPNFDELYSAQRGAGAALNGKPIQVKPPDPNQPAAFFACCARTHRRYEVSIPYKPRILGSAAYGLCAVARGVAVLGFEATPKIWDLAAGWLVVREAGGAIACLHGDDPFPLQTGVDYRERSFPTISAARDAQIAWARQRIQPRLAMSS